MRLSKGHFQKFFDLLTRRIIEGEIDPMDDSLPKFDPDKKGSLLWHTEINEVYFGEFFTGDKHRGRRYIYTASLEFYELKNEHDQSDLDDLTYFKGLVYLEIGKSRHPELDFSSLHIKNKWHEVFKLDLLTELNQLFISEHYSKKPMPNFMACSLKNALKANYPQPSKNKDLNELVIQQKFTNADSDLTILINREIKIHITLPTTYFEDEFQKLISSKNSNNVLQVLIQNSEKRLIVKPLTDYRFYKIIFKDIQSLVEYCKESLLFIDMIINAILESVYGPKDEGPRGPRIIGISYTTTTTDYDDPSYYDSEFWDIVHSIDK